MPQSPAPEPLEALLQKARQGDAQALGRLAERFRGPLLERIRLMLGDEARRCAESLDFVQGALLEVVRRPPPARAVDERGFLRWVTAIARNNIRDVVRRRRERALASLSASLSAADLPARGAPTPSREAERHEDELRLIEAIEELPASQRQAVELRDLEGLSFAEIGARTGRSADAAQMLHTRALARLGKALGGG